MSTKQMGNKVAIRKYFLSDLPLMSKDAPTDASRELAKLTKEDIDELGPLCVAQIEADENK